jgi:glycopeptide antibiotics resistance protein
MIYSIRIDKKVVWGLLGVYTAFLLYMMLIGFGRTAPGADTLEYRWNLVPFDTIHRYVFHSSAFSTGQWAINLFGNVGVFMPYGLLLPVLAKGCRSPLGMLLAFLPCLFVAELLQLVLRVGSFDVDDFILNALGACCGYAAYAWLRRRGRTSKR